MPHLGTPELLALLLLGILLFGKRLPEVGRSLGKGIVEFKKGLRGIEEDVDDQINRSSSERRNDDRTDAKSPKFDDPK